MIIQKMGLGVFLAVVAITMIFTTLSLGPAMAGQSNDKRVEKTLAKRTEGFCKAVLRSWLAAEEGMKDGDVQALVADCYTGHARLAVLGVKPTFPLEDLALSEVPAHLLSKNTGINLDIYRPLAGRVLQTLKVER